MKDMIQRIKGLIILLSIAVFVMSCGDSNSTTSSLTKGLPGSCGKTLEVVLVVEDNVYTPEIRDSIGKCFEKACQDLPQREPEFDIVQLTPSKFNNSDLLKKHRNIIIIDMQAGNNNTIKKGIDDKVYPQSVFRISVDNKDSLLSILHQYAPTMRQQFKTNEHKRMYVAFKKDENVNLTEKINKKYGIKLTFSSAFYMAKNDKDFMWIRKETTNESYNIMIYQVPYTSEKLFNQDKIIETRDKISKQYIPGSIRNSYMGTETRVDVHRDSVRIGNYTAVETRGLWRLFGDFMGGPFINYCFLNTKTNKLIMIDCFLYAPRKEKRDFLMQLESVVYNIQ